MTSDPKVIQYWGAIITSTISMVTFTAALGAAFFFKDPALLQLAMGAAIANATATVQFWIGSSYSSQKKDATIEKVTNAAASGPGPAVAP